MIVFSKNTPSLDRQHVKGVLNIPTSSALGKYLGCASFQGRPSSEVFQNLSHKAHSKLSNWKANALSKAGRVVLIQSNLEALPSHTMQCFQLPASLSSELDRINREFFWKKSNSEKGLPMVAWDKICRPKKLGGLGLAPLILPLWQNSHGNFSPKTKTIGFNRCVRNTAPLVIFFSTRKNRLIRGLGSACCGLEILLSEVFAGN